MEARQKDIESAVYRNVLIAWRLLSRAEAIHYSAGVPATRWGDAIGRLLAERGWTKRQLAEAAAVRPNTVTNLLTHGRDSDTVTLTRIAHAFGVDISELFLTREQSVVLHAHREDRVERLRDMVIKELSATVTKLVTQELEHSGTFKPLPIKEGSTIHYAKPKRRSRAKR
jgi:transcriptional regulator with XRE-family HTH domain